MIFSGILILLVSVGATGIYLFTMEIKEEVKIIVYKNDKKIILDPKSKYFKRLQKECEEMFVSADEVLDEIVTKQKIKAVRGNLAVEILYQKPKEFSIQSDKSQMKVDALLISLDFERKIATIYHSLGGYSAGPFLNTKRGLKQVELIFRSIGIFKK
jgi:hypothetical protein